MNKTCNLPPESRVEGLGLATFAARTIGKVLTPAFLVGSVLSMPSSAQTKFSIVSKMPITLPFELIDNRVFVEVLLDGSGPLHFILDTGAGGFSLTDTAAQKLGLRVVESGLGTGVGEKTVRVGRMHIARLQLGSLQFEDVDANVLPGGDSGNVFGKKPVDGIVGLAVFERVLVKHDYIHKRRTLIPPQDFDYQGVAIDSISTSKLVLPDVRDRIRHAKVGTKITLLVKSKGKQRRVTIVLRDLV